jgi:hypothetical protein
MITYQVILWGELISNDYSVRGLIISSEFRIVSALPRRVFPLLRW